MIPVITSFTPTSGRTGSGRTVRGDTITITGTNLGKVATVVFAGASGEAPFAAKGTDENLDATRVHWGILRVISETEITATIPPSAVTGKIRVQGGDGHSAASTQTLTITGSY